LPADIAALASSGSELGQPLGERSDTHPGDWSVGNQQSIDLLAENAALAA
jgi:hypothetical protein